MVVQLLLRVFLCRQNRPGMADSLTYTSSEQVQVVTTAAAARSAHTSAGAGDSERGAASQGAAAAACSANVSAGRVGSLDGAGGQHDTSAGVLALGSSTQRCQHNAECHPGVTMVQQPHKPRNSQHWQTGGISA